MPWRGLRAACVVASVAAAMLVPAVAEAVDFQPSKPLVGNSTVFAPILSDVAIGGEGTVGVVYIDTNLPSSGTKVAVLRPDGAAEAPITLETNATGRIAVDGTGDALVASASVTASGAWLRRRQAGSSFGAPVALPGATGWAADAAFLPDGRAVAAWATATGVVAAEVPAGGSAPGASAPISDAGDLTIIGQVVVTVGPRGEVVVTWVSSDGAQLRLRAAVRRPGVADFDAPQTIAPVQGSASPASVAFRDDGTIDAVWSQSVPGPFTEVKVLWAGRGPGAGAPWTTPAALLQQTPIGFGTIAPDAAGGGSLALVWPNLDPSGARVALATAVGGAGPTVRTPLGATPPGSSGPQVAPLRDGRHLVTWLGAATPPALGTMQYAIIGPDGTVETSGAFPGETGAPGLLASTPDGGRGALVWNRSTPPPTPAQTVIVVRYAEPAPPAAPATPLAAPTPPPAPPPPPRSTQSSLDTERPVVSRVRLTRRRFAVAARPTAKRANRQQRKRQRRRRVPRGTTLRWRLSEPSRVTMRVVRVRRGYRVGRRCVLRRPKRTSGQRARRLRRCTHTRRAGTLRRDAEAGNGSLRFTGRVGRRALRPGRYRFELTAVDDAGNRSRRKRTSFRVVRAPRRR